MLTAFHRVCQNAILHSKSLGKSLREPLRLVIAAPHATEKMQRGSGDPVNVVEELGGNFTGEFGSQIKCKVSQAPIFDLMDEFPTSVVIVENREHSREWLIKRQLAGTLSLNSILCTQGACITPAGEDSESLLAGSAQETRAPRHRFVAEHTKWREHEFFKRIEEKPAASFD